MDCLVVSLRFLFLISSFWFESQEPIETHLTGVYQGKTLFIQNPYHPVQKEFCISEVYVNGRSIDLNQRFSAIKLDFTGVDMFAPVSIKIIQRDSCNLTIINPDAINFHSTFSFKDISFNDSTIVWKAAGESDKGNYEVEKYRSGIWTDETSITAKGVFGESTYEYYPELEEGANKFRVKYIYQNGNYLYSPEVDFHYYPDPVTFSPKSSATTINLSRSVSFEVFDAGGDLVLTGFGMEMDIRQLPSGDYFVYFDGKYPGVFSKK